VQLIEPSHVRVFIIYVLITRKFESGIDKRRRDTRKSRWYVALREEPRLRVFANRVTR
jgi:hypothetical protein